MEWLESEREWFSPTRELRRLKRRAQARWLIVLGAAVLLTAFAMRKLSKAPSTYTARVILKVTESDLLRDQSPLVGRGLADYLLEAALRSDDLAELLRRNNIYAGELEVGETFAANVFRGDLAVDVYRNYFAVSRGYSEGARTARISIRYRDRDPDRAMAVVREVAALMAKTEADNRRRSSLNLAQIARVSAEAAETRLENLQERSFTKRRDLEALGTDEAKGPSGTQLAVELRSLDIFIERQGERLRKAREQLEQIELREAVVGRSLGVDFRIVDERPPERAVGLGGALLGMVGLVIFAVLFPLVAIGVGAFDVRVHDGEDVERLGLPMLGRLADSGDSTPSSHSTRSSNTSRTGKRVT